MDANTLSEQHKKTADLRFMGGMQGTVPHRMLLSCPWDGALTLYCVCGKSLLTAGRSRWEIPDGGLVFVRKGQTPVLSAEECPIRLLYLIIGGDLPFTVNGSAMVFVPNQPPVPAELFATLLDSLPAEGESALLLQFFRQIRTSVHPLSPNGIRPPESIRLLKEIFDTRYAEKLTLNSLAAELHWNKYKLEKDFKKYFGCSPFEYLLNVRVQAACGLLCKTGRSVFDVGLSVGVENTSYFIRIFKQHTGMSPLEYRTRFSE